MGQYNQPIDLLPGNQLKNIFFSYLKRRIHIPIGKKGKCEHIILQSMRLLNDAGNGAAMIFRLQIRHEYCNSFSDLLLHFFFSSSSSNMDPPSAPFLLHIIPYNTEKINYIILTHCIRICAIHGKSEGL